MLSNAIQEKMRARLKGMELWYEVVVSKKNGRMTNKLAVMLTDLVTRHGKSRRYYKYKYRDDMEAHAMMMLCKTWDNFKPELSDNPFAYYTSCIIGSFCYVLNKERKERDIKEELQNMVDEEQHF